MWTQDNDRDEFEEPAMRIERSLRSMRIIRFRRSAEGGMIHTFAIHGGPIGRSPTRMDI